LARSRSGKSDRSTFGKDKALHLAASGPLPFGYFYGRGVSECDIPSIEISNKMVGDRMVTHPVFSDLCKAERDLSSPQGERKLGFIF
jgi:hypothetical protein